jgi:glycosyltransferase involved in cell wall biosynthesis
LKHAAGFINITKESFGIATAEALLCGVPVLGFDQ